MRYFILYEHIPWFNSRYRRWALRSIWAVGRYCPVVIGLTGIEVPWSVINWRERTLSICRCLLVSPRSWLTFRSMLARFRVCFCYETVKDWSSVRTYKGNDAFWWKPQQSIKFSIFTVFMCACARFTWSSVRYTVDAATRSAHKYQNLRRINMNTWTKTQLCRDSGEGRYINEHRHTQRSSRCCCSLCWLSYKHYMCVDKGARRKRVRAFSKNRAVEKCWKLIWTHSIRRAVSDLSGWSLSMCVCVCVLSSVVCRRRLPGDTAETHSIYTWISLKLFATYTIVSVCSGARSCTLLNEIGKYSIHIWFMLVTRAHFPCGLRFSLAHCCCLKRGEFGDSLKRTCPTIVAEHSSGTEREGMSAHSLRAAAEQRCEYIRFLFSKKSCLYSMHGSVCKQPNSAFAIALCTHIPYIWKKNYLIFRRIDSLWFPGMCKQDSFVWLQCDEKIFTKTNGEKKAMVKTRIDCDWRQIKGRRRADTNRVDVCCGEFWLKTNMSLHCMRLEDRVRKSVWINKWQTKETTEKSHVSNSCGNRLRCSSTKKNGIPSKQPNNLGCRVETFDIYVVRFFLLVMDVLLTLLGASTWWEFE